MATVDALSRFAPPPAGPDSGTRTAFLVVDTESVPDGDLLSRVKWPGENLSPDAAIERAAKEQAETSWNKSDFIPVSFHLPVAICVVRVGADFSLQQFACLDAPQFRPREVVKKFWYGVSLNPRCKLVTFNGRGFDLPLLELAAFRYGVTCRDYYQGSRNRYGGNTLDLCDWMSNYGAARMAGGLNLLAKLLGKPGKMDVAGDKVLEMHRAGKLREINDYCLCDTLDTYFVFLRSRVLTGDLSCEQEADLLDRARDLLEGKADEFPALREYLDRWDER